jgi:hypothetical protein
MIAARVSHTFMALGRAENLRRLENLTRTK